LPPAASLQLRDAYLSLSALLINDVFNGLTGAPELELSQLTILGLLEYRGRRD
jgi:hypothetical protein